MIIITLPCLLLGGTEFQTLHLLKALKSLNQEVRVAVYFEVAEEMLSLYENEGAIVNCLNWKRSISPLHFIIQLNRYFKVIKPSIVHVQYMAPGALPIFAAKLAGVPRIIATIHQPYTKSHGWKAKFLLCLAAQFCKPFLSVSLNAARSWFGRATLIDTQKPITQQPSQLTLYNSIDVDLIQRIATQYQFRKDLSSLGIHPQTYLFGAVSRLRIEKGLDLLITAFAQLLQTSDRDLRLLIVGDGQDRKELETMAAELNYQDKIVFYGAAAWEEAMQLMARMDVVVVPSRFEGFGLSAAEAMAMSKPLICSNAFGLTELVSNDKEGLLFQNGDEQDLFLKLQYMVLNPEKAKKMGEHAFNKVKQNFDYPLFVNRLKTLYKIEGNESN
jgi:glycosyltransferase involved in cell wall biosynthesis